MIGGVARGATYFKPHMTLESPLTVMMKKDFGKNIPPIFLIYYGNEPQLFITDPHLVEDIYVKCNKYLDKDEFARNIFYPLMGESILLSASNHLWSSKRNVLGTAFYKDKLLKMIDLVKIILREVV